MATYTVINNNKKYNFPEVDNNCMCIYSITNTLNGKRYIGQTQKNVILRWRSHCNNSSNFISAIKKAIKKYGHENFLFEIIDVAKTIDELNSLETKYIKEYGTMYPQGYNLHTGGNNHEVSDISKQRMSESACNRWGVDKSKKQIKKELTPEQIEQNKINRILKMSISKKGIISPMKGKSHTKESIIKNSIAHKGKEIPKKWKKISASNGNIYNSVKETYLTIGCNRTTLMKHLRGTLKSVYGLKYNYI